MSPYLLSCQFSANQRKAEMSTNACKQTLKGIDVITNVISANQHFVLPLSMQQQQQQQHKLYLHDYNYVVTVLQKL